MLPQTALALLLFPAIALAQTDCAIGDAASQAGETPSVIVFENISDFAYSVYWVDYDGQPVPYGEVWPTGGMSIETYRSHPWLIEVAGPKGVICIGPVSADSAERCRITLAFSGDIAVSTFSASCTSLAGAGG